MFVDSEKKKKSASPFVVYGKVAIDGARRSMNTILKERLASFRPANCIFNFVTLKVSQEKPTVFVLSNVSRTVYDIINSINYICVI